MTIIPFATKNTSHDALADFITDLMARNLSPERMLVTLLQRLSGVTANDLILATLSALTTQRALLAVNECDILNLSQQVDGLEAELRDLQSEIGRLQHELSQFEFQREGEAP
jgi:hypothetical protein